MDMNLSKLQETRKTEGPGRLQPMGLQKSEATQQLNSRCHIELLQMQEGDDSKRWGAPRRTLEGHVGSQGASTSPILGQGRAPMVTLLFTSKPGFCYVPVRLQSNKTNFLKRWLGRSWLSGRKFWAGEWRDHRAAVENLWAAERSSGCLQGPWVGSSWPLHLSAASCLLASLS